MIREVRSLLTEKLDVPRIVYACQTQQPTKNSYSAQALHKHSSADILRLQLQMEIREDSHDMVLMTPHMALPPLLKRLEQ